MIAQLEGRVAGRDKDALIIAVGGIGFRVLVPSSLLASVHTGDVVALFTHLQVRENDLSLYGCPTQEEMTLFEQFVSVSGVGPKLALALLSAMPPDALRLAIGQGQVEMLTRVPGIGKRTAERIVFHLKEALAIEAPPPELAELAEADRTVIDALTGLGYSLVEAQRAVQGLPAEVTDIEERLRLALTQFARP